MNGAFQLMACAALLLVPLRPGFGRDVGGAGGSCPDQRASHVPPVTQEVEPIDSCSLRFVVMGIEVAVVGPDCPSAKLTYPSRNVCAGAPSKGNYCAVVGEVDVRRERCECRADPRTPAAPWILTCECWDEGTAGHLPDAGTFACES